MGEDSGDERVAVQVREQDRFLPIANISRIMKKALPSNGKIAKDAKETVQECVSEFISFITSEASDKCARDKRKTINGDDLLWALHTLGFEEYVEPLKVYLHKYREAEKASMAKQGQPDKSKQQRQAQEGAQQQQLQQQQAMQQQMQISQMPMGFPGSSVMMNQYGGSGLPPQQ
eukprot:jgi/Astpho2/2217/Aster-03201